METGMPAAAQTTPRESGWASSLFAFDRFDDRIAVAVDRHGEDERTAADGAIFNQLLSAAATRIDCDVVVFGT